VFNNAWKSSLLSFSRNKLRETKSVNAGEIGYIVTGIKEPGVARVGDTVTTQSKPLPAFPGYAEPVPIVFASIYPESQDEFDDLRSSLSKLKLSDSSLTARFVSGGHILSEISAAHFRWFDSCVRTLDQQ
jgi:translation elongation factor EF-4